ncbi:MAG: VWA domain-containing protein [Candidatus Eisenbacteria bacterium]|nr:VWA domain-containing protein [Candidatus Eisenbacteria bacterium]
MTGIPTLHLAPHAAWPALVAATLALAAASLWAYRFAAPPLPASARRLLAALRFFAAALLLWLLAQPTLERTRHGASRLVVLLDRSRSMELPVGAGGPSRAGVASRAVESLRRALIGRAAVEVIPFAATLEPDTARGTPERGATALGRALEQLAGSAAGQRASAVVVVSDGAVNSGADPVDAARSLGLPVHAVRVGERGALDRVITGIEAPPDARVGRSEPVRVHLVSSEPRGVTIPVRLMDGAREIARGAATSPGAGVEVVVEMSGTPLAPGLAVWTARIDTLPAELTASNNERSVALKVAPGRIGVMIVSAGLNWDLTFVRRALAGDSSLALTTWTREAGRWRSLGRGGAPSPGAGVAPDPAGLRAQAVVVLDGIAAAEVSALFDRALATFVREGGGLLALGGPAPGLTRYRSGALGADLHVTAGSESFGRGGAPSPDETAGDLTAWDDDPARGQQAWRDAAPLSDVLALESAAGDRVLIGSGGGGPPLVLSRRVGRGQALLVNGAGVWRWSLSPTDDLAGERGRRLWRRIVRWLAEPVQGEPLRVRPERWLTSAGEPLRLFATLQDSAFRPLADARVEGQLTMPGGATRSVRFEPREAGVYVATLEGLTPGRHRVSVRAAWGRGGEIARAASEFAVDRWSLEEAGSEPDSATLANVARAS